MKVNVADLVTAVRVLDNVPSRSGILSSEFVRLQTGNRMLRLSLASEMSGVVFVGADESKTSWTFFAERRRLFSFILALSDVGERAHAVVQYNATNNELRLKCAHRAVQLQGVDTIAGYGDTGKADSTVLELTEEQRARLAVVGNYAPIDPTLEALNCIYVKAGFGMFATDRVGFFIIRDKTLKTTTPVATALCTALSVSGVKHVYVAPHGTRIDFNQGHLYQSVHELCSASFPVSQVLTLYKKAGGLSVTAQIDGSNLLEVVQRLTGYVGLSSRDETTMEWKGTVGDKHITITSQAGQGTFTERLPLPNVLKQEVEFRLSLRRIVPLAEFAKECTISLRTSKTAPFLVFSVPDRKAVMIHAKAI